jgi:hypothetical protein
MLQPFDYTELSRNDENLTRSLTTITPNKITYLEDNPKHFTRESSDASRIRVSDAESRKRTNWFFRKEFFNVINSVWLIFGIFIGCSVLSITIIITIASCRQVKVDSETTTLQSGRFVSETCSSASDCLENAFCNTNSKCECVPDFYYNSEVGQCLKLKSHGFYCEDGRECNIFQHLDCINSICSCSSTKVWANYYGSYDCVRFRQVGQVCQSSSHCVPSSYCTYTGSDYRCQCPTGYYASEIDGQCYLQKKALEKCDGNYQECPSYAICRGKYGDTVNKFCLCVSGYYYDHSARNCVVLKSYGGSCYNSSQCQQVNLECVSGVCTCLSNQFWNGSWCVNYVKYGQPCFVQAECDPLDSNLVCGVPPLG